MERNYYIWSKKLLAHLESAVYLLSGIVAILFLVAMGMLTIAITISYLIHYFGGY